MLRTTDIEPPICWSTEWTKSINAYNNYKMLASSKHEPNLSKSNHSNSNAKHRRTTNSLSSLMQNKFLPTQTSVNQRSDQTKLHLWMTFPLRPKGVTVDQLMWFGAQPPPRFFILIINTIFPSAFHKSLWEQHRFACLHLPPNDSYAISVLTDALPLYDRAAESA